MKSVKVFCFLLITLGLQLKGYSQKNVIEISVRASTLTPVNANLVDYSNFTLVVKNNDPKLTQPFSVIEKEGYFNLELKEKRKNILIYRVRPTEKTRGRKRALRLLLKTEEKTEGLTIIYFSSGTLDLDRMKKDTILELGFTDHSPNFRSHYVNFHSYSIVREGSDSYTPVVLKGASITLNKLWIGNHWLMADNDTLFKIRVTPPLTLVRTEEKQSRINRNFKQADSLAIFIGYAERVDRIQWFSGGEININICDDQFSFTHKTKNPKRQSCSFEGINKGILGAVLNLETKGKVTPECLSVNEDGVFIRMIINDQKTNFEFCTKDWDGIQEFIDKIVAMKTTEVQKE